MRTSLLPITTVRSHDQSSGVGGATPRGRDTETDLPQDAATVPLGPPRGREARRQNHAATAGDRSLLKGGDAICLFVVVPEGFTTDRSARRGESAVKPCTQGSLKRSPMCDSNS